jgi:hypothetical protein
MKGGNHWSILEMCFRVVRTDCCLRAQLAVVITVETTKNRSAHILNKSSFEVYANINETKAIVASLFCYLLHVITKLRVRTELHNHDQNSHLQFFNVSEVEEILR